jgi:hypothetical protein
MVADSAALAASPICCKMGPCILVPCITVDVRFLLTIFKTGAENVFHQLADTSDLTNMLFSAHQSYDGYL